MSPLVRAKSRLSGGGFLFPSLSLRIPVLLILPVLLFPVSSAVAGETADKEEAVALFERSVSKAGALCRGILMDIKHTSDAYPPESLSPSSRETARAELARTTSLVRLFRAVREEAEGLERAAMDLLERDEDGGAEEERARMREASERLRAYGRYVNRFWEEATDRYGEPPAPEIPTPGTRPAAEQGAGRPVRITGEIRTGLGKSSYDRPNATPDPEKASGTLFEGFVRANGVLPNGTELLAEMGRESRVVRREITLSRVALAARHRFPAGWNVEGGVSRRGYDDDEVEEAGYGETRLHAAIGYDGPGPRFRAGAERRGRSHSGVDPDTRDFRVTTLRAEGDVGVGAGRLLASLARIGHDVEADEGDFTILHPTLTWRTSERDGGAEAHASWERFRYADDESADQDRLRGHLRFPRRGPRSRGYVGPEASVITYPNADEAGYGDYGIAGRSDGTAGALGEGTRRNSAWRLFYRRHRWEDAFDFVAFSWSDRRTPVRRGWVREFGFTAKGYVEQADYDTVGDTGANPSPEDVYTSLGDVVNAFQTTREPHRADLHLFLGRRLRPSPLLIRSLEIGGSIGHSLFLDSERHRLQEKADDLVAELPDSLSEVTPLGETDFLFRNTVNQVRWGVRASAEIVPAPRASGRAAVRFDQGLYYNGDPIQTTRSLDVRIDGAYALRPDLALELRLELHRTRVGDAGSPQDFNRSEFALRCRYRFSGAIPLAGAGGEYQ
ncbi:MAG: hypothetical protein JW958_12060 [Candidatus Eisenbacteria bacterium]|nr:hypothetical protein [Candidatus Eisenbacteria bacterium]